MNQELLVEIVKHIFLQLVPDNGSKSLLSDEFILSDKLKFEFDKDIVSKNIYGCEFNTQDTDFKILLGDCSYSTKEYVLIISLSNSPTYGIYINQSNLDECIIACTLGDSWLVCNTGLQATFLAGMEQLKELIVYWKKCEKYEKQLNLMKSFLEFEQSHYLDNEE
jgi:hypothetical protein